MDVDIGNYHKVFYTSDEDTLHYINKKNNLIIKLF